jgi:cell division protease FtsH
MGVVIMRGKKQKIIIYSLLAIVILVGVLIFSVRNSPLKMEITYKTFLDDVKAGKIDTVFLDDKDKLSGVYKNGDPFVTDNPRKPDLKEELLLQGVKVDEKSGSFTAEGIISFVLLIGLFIGLMYFLDRKSSRQTQNSMAKLSSVKVEDNSKTGVDFSSVAGNEEAKESVKELVDFIKEPKKYTQYGARLPRGIIFYGPPGTGKTLMAKALAGEAQVPFYAVSGSDFVQVYVGLGAGRIRDLFNKARQSGKCVIFIDEIDALGKKRNGGIEGGNDERDQTLNALLSEMSGFDENEGIVVIAATNRLDVLDDALLRPGRFDRHIEIGLPDVNGRLEILKLHSRNKPMDPNLNLRELAEETVFFSGAMLENLLNEAAIFAAKRSSGTIQKSDIDRAFYTAVAGSEKKDRSSLLEKDKRITAYHEAGHALVTRLLAPENRVTKVTIIPSTKGAGGFSMNIPPDRMYHRKKDMEQQIQISLAGRAAEELIFGQDGITTGASNDLEKATEIMVSLVKRFGMNDMAGMLNYDILYGSSNGISADIVKECKKQMDELYNNTKKVVKDNISLLHSIAQNLLERETLGEQELNEIISQKLC